MIPTRLASPRIDKPANPSAIRRSRASSRIDVARSAPLPVVGVDLVLRKSRIDDLDIPLAKLLHGEQSFSYYCAACAGDTVTVRSIVSDIYHKKDGALEFIVRTSHAVNQRDELVAVLRTVLVCCH